MSRFRNKVIAAMLASSLAITGCAPPLVQTHGKVSFESGLKAVHEKNFPAAAYHFAELSKAGDPGAMNNLGVSLLMVDRKEEAIYWFEKAARFGDSNAVASLQQMGLPVPPADLVGRHGQQMASERSEQAGQMIVEAVLLGLLLGVTFKAAQYSAPQRGVTVFPTLPPSEPAKERKPVQIAPAQQPADARSSRVATAMPVAQTQSGNSSVSSPVVQDYSNTARAPSEVYSFGDKLNAGCRDDSFCNGGRCVKSPTSATGVCLEVIKDNRRIDVTPRPATTGLYTGPKSTSLLGDKGQCEKDYECPSRSRCNPVLKVCVAN